MDTGAIWAEMGLYGLLVAAGAKQMILLQVLLGWCCRV